MKIRRGLGRIALLAGLVPAMGGCVIDVADVCVDGDSCGGGAEATAYFSYSVPALYRTTLALVGANGSVRIRVEAELQDVIIQGTRRVRADSRAEAKTYLDRVRVDVTEDDDGVVVKTEQPAESAGRTYQVDYEIAVPSWMAVRVTNGNGTVKIQNVHQDVDVENGNGDVVLEGHQGSSRISLGNGEIRGAMALPPGAHLIHSVGNGGIHLTIQRDLSAEFHAQVGIGTLDVTGLNFTSWVSGPGFADGLLGDGEGLMTLSVGNGWIQIQGVSGT
jgi:hypothetical protein